MKKAIIYASLILLITLLAIMGLRQGYFAKSGAETVEERQGQSLELQFANRTEVQAFAKENLKKPIPEDFKIPTYITSGFPLEQVYDSLAIRFPQFYGFTGVQYLDSIWRRPQLYLQLINESKAIRRYYDPNSEY